MQEVIKDDSKPPFNKLLNQLEELMGKEKFGHWLADKYPHFESFEARKRRAWLDEFLYAKEVELEFQAFQQWKLLQECENEKMYLQKIAREYYLYILLFFRELEQYEIGCLRRLKLLQKLMMDKIEELKQQLQAYLKKLAEKLFFIELMLIRLYRILDRLEQSIKLKTEALIQSYFKIISTLSGSGNLDINKIYSTLSSDLRKVKIGAKSIIDFHLDFRTQISVVRNLNYRTHQGIETQFTQLNDDMHALIEDREDREECINFLETVKNQKEECLKEEKQTKQDLKVIEKSQAEVIYLTPQNTKNSYAAITALFEKTIPFEVDHLLDSSPNDATTLEAIKEALSEIMVLEDDEEDMLGSDEMNMDNQMQLVEMPQLLEKSQC